MSNKTDWPMVKFGDVVRLNTDRCADPAHEGIDRYVGLEHIEPEDLRIRHWGLVAEGTTFTNRFQPGQVLFGKRRAYQRKVAVADFEGVCSGDIYVFEPKDKRLLPELLPFLCQTEGFFEHAVGTSAGSLSPRTNWTQLANYEFALPSLEEQRRIIGVLDAAHRAIISTQSAFQSAKLLLAAATENFANQAAIQGRTIRVERLVRDDKPITYGILKPGTGYPGGIPVIKVKDYPNGEIVTEDLLLTSPAIEVAYKRSRLEENDLLISIRGTVGRLAFVPSILTGANITQDTARLSIHESFNRYYIRFMMESDYVQRQLTSRITGMAVQGINIGELRKVEVPIVDYEHQNQIADQLLQIMQAALLVKDRYKANTSMFKHVLAKIIGDAI